MDLRRVLVLVAVLAGAMPQISSAAPRSLSIPDPTDGTPTVSGQPGDPDVSRLAATYDPEVGTLSITVDFYQPLSAIGGTDSYAWWSSFTVGAPDDPKNPNTGCNPLAAGGLSGQQHVLSPYQTFFDQATVTGYAGRLPFSRTSSDTSITITASSSVIANRDYRCITYALNARSRRPASDINSRYDEYCDCWYISGQQDAVGVDDRLSPYEQPRVLWFPGFKPVLVKVATRLTWTPHRGHRRLDLWDWTVLPDTVLDEDRAWTGKLVFRISKGNRVVLVRQAKPSQLEVGKKLARVKLAPGRYKVKVYYTGDAFRNRSSTITRFVQIRR